jgi:hypothetical protein
MIPVSDVGECITRPPTTNLIGNCIAMDVKGQQTYGLSASHTTCECLECPDIKIKYHCDISGGKWTTSEEDDSIQRCIDCPKRKSFHITVVIIQYTHFFYALSNKIIVAT